MSGAESLTAGDFGGDGGAGFCPRGCLWGDAASEKLELEANCVAIQCVYFDKSRDLNQEELHLLSELHYKKIDISDAIYVVNVGGYIGQSTQREIEYARSLNKEVLFLEPVGK